MLTPTMDTHEVVKELKAAGFSAEQAEAVTRVVRNAHNIDLSHLATKADLQALSVVTKADLQAQSAATRADLQAQSAATKADLQAQSAAIRADLQAQSAATRADMQIQSAEFNARLSDLKSDILKWVMGTISLQTLVILGTVITLIRMMH